MGRKKKEVKIEKTNEDPMIVNALKSIEKEYGKGIIINIGDNYKMDIDTIPTGSISLDKALGVGGVPRGRVIELYGNASAGKTTLALSIIKQAQLLGLRTAYIDAEHAMDLLYAKKFGINIKKWIFSQPDYGEQCLDVVQTLVETVKFGIIIVDSVAALTPKAEHEGTMSDQQIGLQARMISKFLRKNVAILEKTNTCLIFINQIRCIHKDTLLNTQKGILTANHLKIGDNIQDKKVLNVSKNITDGYKLSIKNHSPLIISKNHKQTVIRNGIKLDILAFELKCNDWILKNINNNNINIKKTNNDIKIKALKNCYYNCKKVLLPTIIDNDVSEFFGMYLADGCCIDKKNTSNYKIGFTENHIGRRVELLRVIQNIFNKKLNIKNPAIQLNGRYYVEFIKYFDLGYTARYKKFNVNILNKMSINNIKKFIKGSTFDSHFKNKGTVFVISNSSVNLANNLVSLLSFFNINTNTIFNNRKRTFEIYLNGRDLINYQKNIGFYDYQRKIYKKPKLYNNARGKFDIIPHELGTIIFKDIRKTCKKITSSKSYNNINTCYYVGLNYSRLKLLNLIQDVHYNNNFYINLLMNNLFSYIENIELIKGQEFIDVEVDGDHRFYANNILTHNSKIGVFGFGEKTTTPGGRALKFFSSVRIYLSRLGNIKHAEKPIGTKVCATVKKNKVAPPFLKGEFKIYFDEGISQIGEIIDYAIKLKIIEKSGGWLQYKNENIAHGIEKLRQLLRNDNKLYEEIKIQVMEALNKEEEEEVEHED